MGMMLLLLAPVMVLQGLTAGEDRSAPLLAVPALGATTVAAEGALPAWAPAFVNPSATVERQYTLQGRGVGLYLGYYRGQGPQRKLVSSDNALVRSDDRSWLMAETGSRSVNLGQQSAVVRTARIRRPLSSQDDSVLVAWQIYWVNGQFEARDARAKAWGAWHRLLGRGDDGAVIVVYAQEKERGDADAVLEDFLRKHLAAIETQLRRTRDGE